MQTTTADSEQTSLLVFRYGKIFVLKKAVKYKFFQPVFYCFTFSNQVPGTFSNDQLNRYLIPNIICHLELIPVEFWYG